jgi:outer membrane murein-binding lipoprotein Lpp
VKITNLKIHCVGILAGTILLAGCSKHAEKIADTYVGSLNANDTLLSSNAEVLIQEIDKSKVAIISDAFLSYEVEIDKKRYFASKSYFSVDPNEQIEVFDDGTITLIHNDNEGINYTFIGARK